MNIVVLLRAVRDPASFTVNRKAQKIFVQREAYRLNPSDQNALEAALRLLQPEHTLTAAALGGAPAEDVLRQARARGAHRALLVQDETLQSADAAVITRVALRLLEHLGGAGLLLLGAEVVDADLAQVGPRLAAALERPFVQAAHAVDPVEAGAQAVTAIIEGAGGYRRVSAELSAVISVARDCNQPRFAPAGQIIRVYSDPSAVEVITPADLGLAESDLAPASKVLGESFPAERTFGQVLDGTPDELGRQLADACRLN